ncbi:leucine-rich_repeat domain-containing protein [Hexamita inflata]|uniref:Leucine-rich repeat domain-containing protein n=1 Tax=Hexamita inflata TaxID=28002 RepID=A0AA86N4Z5_9EUKA|nr:leucine-rich repeat domain-containing protein [Hexamita inflata]
MNTIKSLLNQCVICENQATDKQLIKQHKKKVINECIWLEDDQELIDFSFVDQLNVSQLSITNCKSINLSSELRRVSHLKVKYSALKSLLGIEQMTQLTELYLYNNQLTDISPLQHLTNLKYLNLNENKVSDVTPLQFLTNLKYLELFSNKIIYLRCLENLKLLNKLYLGCNRIIDVKPLLKLNQLQILVLQFNAITVDKQLINTFKHIQYVNFDGQRPPSIHELKQYRVMSQFDYLQNKIQQIYNEQNNIQQKHTLQMQKIQNTLLEYNSSIIYAQGQLKVLIEEQNNQQ